MFLQAADSAAKAAPRIVFRRDLSDLFNPAELSVVGGRVLAALVVGWVAYSVLKLVLRRIEASLGEPDPASISLHEQRARTLVSLVRSVGIVIITIIVLLMVLSALGVDLKPLLAGAGVIGLAISFGSQSLVKDIISGLFILFENQFGVGDVIRLDGVSGMVESMTLRVVVLRDVHGTVHVIPNGEIKRVSNLTRSWSRAVLDVGVAHREDADRVMEVMRDEGRLLWEDPLWKPLLIEPVEVPGVESVTETATNVRIMVKTLPLKQWDVARELRRRLKRRFDAEGIALPFATQTLSWGEGHLPVALSAVAEAKPVENGEHGAHEAM